MLRVFAESHGEFPVRTQDGAQGGKMFVFHQPPVIEHSHAHLRCRVDRAQNCVKGAQKEGFPPRLGEAVEFSRVELQRNVEKLVFKSPIVEKLFPARPMLQIDLGKTVHFRSSTVIRLTPLQAVCGAMA